MTGCDPPRYRVLRGDSWLSGRRDALVSFRVDCRPDVFDIGVGLRGVVSPGF
jgi:hypothetical protein